MMRYILIFLVFFSNHILYGQDMALIPAGVYEMGKNSEKAYDFSPAHSVKVDSFYIDTHEVTNAAYKKFCEDTGHKLPEFWNKEIFRCGDKFPDHPVIGVTWYDANKFAEWAGKRLPTEAEWEYAARGGLVGKEFPNGNDWTKIRKQNKPGEWENQTDPVKKYEPNGYGLYDMGGNVWEWVSDWYDRTYYLGSESDNPKGPKNGSNKVIRSGSWHSGTMCKKVYYRKGLPGSWVDFAVGFRCAKDLKP